MCVYVRIGHNKLSLFHADVVVAGVKGAPGEVMCGAAKGLRHV